MRFKEALASLLSGPFGAITIIPDEENKVIPIHKSGDYPWSLIQEGDSVILPTRRSAQVVDDGGLLLAQVFDFRPTKRNNFNKTGRIVLQQPVADGQKNVNLSDTRSGVYIPNIGFFYLE